MFSAMSTGTIFKSFHLYRNSTYAPFLVEKGFKSDGLTFTLRLCSGDRQNLGSWPMAVRI
jgi:hypothetical protein